MANFFDEKGKQLSEEELQEAQERFREDTEDDAVVGNVYSDYMHGERVTK